MGELSEDGPDDWEGLDASAAHIANLLSTEPADGTFQSFHWIDNNIILTPRVGLSVKTWDLRACFS